MTIAVNTRFLLTDYLEGYGNFIFECFSRLAKKYPEHKFIYIFDRPYDARFLSSNNIIPVIAGPPARHPLLWRYWYNYKIPVILRTYKADVFVSADGFCSLRTKVPQCLMVHDLAFIYYPQFVMKSHLQFYKRYTPRFLKKAKTLVTVSEYSKKDIIDTYHIEEQKINVVYNGIKDVFRVFGSTEKEITREIYSAGKEYFLYVGSIHPRKNLFNLLKAFSFFKKRQKSNMQLLIVGRKAWKYEDFMESFKTYKYKNEVKIIDYLPDEELARIMGAAYAMIYPSFYEGFGVPCLEAMKSGVAVVTSNKSALPEICSNAALYCDPADFESMADNMMLVYKDETKRNDLIRQGFERIKSFNWNKTADLLWESILKTMG